MSNVKPAIDEQLELLNKSPNLFAAEMLEMAESTLSQDNEKIEASVNSLAELISDTMKLADLLGRRRMYLEFDALSRRDQPALFHDPFHQIMTFSKTPIVPKIEFQEAFEDIIRREPRLASSREEIQQVYATGGFAVQKIPVTLSNQARLNIAIRIQTAISDFISKGMDIPKKIEEIASIGKFSRAYAETVFRTNLATAYTAGRMKQALDPDIAEVISAFEFSAVGDSDTRPNHNACDGLIAATNDPIWETYSPPLGFNCRCSLRMVDKFELEEKGLLKGGNFVARSFPANFRLAGPDEGFKTGGSTKNRIYG